MCSADADASILKLLWFCVVFVRFRVRLMGVWGMIIYNGCCEPSYINCELDVFIPVDGSNTLPYCLLFIIGEALKVND